MYGKVRLHPCGLLLIIHLNDIYVNTFLLRTL